MSSGYNHPGFVGLVIASVKNLPDPFFFHCFRHAQHVQRQLRFPAHGVDIRNGVGCGNLAKQIGIVHNRRKKVHRLDQCRFVVDYIHAGVIAFVKADDQPRVCPCLEILQQLGQRPCAHLGPAPRAGCQSGQSCFRFHLCPPSTQLIFLPTYLLSAIPLHAPLPLSRFPGKPGPSLRPLWSKLSFRRSCRR